MTTITKEWWRIRAYLVKREFGGLDSSIPYMVSLLYMYVYVYAYGMETPRPL